MSPGQKRTLDRYTKAPEELRLLAQKALRRQKLDTTLNEWEIDFLTSISNNDGSYKYSERQILKTVEIDHQTKMCDAWNGFSIKKLITECYQGRLDLSEADEEWITRVWQRSRKRLFFREARILFGLWNELNYHPE